MITISLQEPSIVDFLICESIEDTHCLVDNYFDSSFDHISKEDQSHDNYDMIVSELDKKNPCPNDINKIPYPILDQDMSVQCVDTDLALNLAIILGTQLKAFFSHQIPRSIIPSHLGENFQSTLPSQLFESSCVGLCSIQDATFEIFSQEFEHGHIIGENALHFPYRSSIMNNIFQFINLLYGWLEKVYKDQFHLFSILTNKWA